MQLSDEQDDTLLQMRSIAHETHGPQTPMVKANALAMVRDILRAVEDDTISYLDWPGMRRFVTEHRASQR